MSELDLFRNDRLHEASFQLCPISEAAAATYILSVKSNAVRCDGISKEFLAYPSTYFTRYHAHYKLVNYHMYRSQPMEASALHAKVNHPTELKNLRPISIQPFMSKILDKAILSHLLKYIEECNFLPAQQSGFRMSKGTITALLDATNNILANQHSCRGTILITLMYIGQCIAKIILF